MASTMTDDFKSHTICPILWHHLSIQQNGDFRMCCQMIDSPFGKFKKENGEFANVQDDTFDSIRNHEAIKEIRKSMLNGEKHKLCNLCWTEEGNNLNSKRTYMNKVILNDKKYDIDHIRTNTNPDGSIDTNMFQLNYYDIRFGNLCNLKCRSCGPSDSSLWYEDYFNSMGGGEKPKPMWFYGSDKYEITKTNNTFDTNLPNYRDDFKWYENEDFWKSFKNNLPQLEMLYLTGGEPTINKAHFKMLEMCIDAGIAHKVYLEYNTNMFAIPDKVYDLWKHFKYIDIGCSIDGKDKMANYLRPPSTWDRLESNLDKLGTIDSKNISAKLSTTISIFNVLHFLELTEWVILKRYKNIQDMPAFHVLSSPKEMSIQVLPLETKKWITDQYEQFYIDGGKKFGPDWTQVLKHYFSGITNYMNSVDNSHLLPKLKAETLKLDNMRNHSLVDVVPWLSEIFDKLPD